MNMHDNPYTHASLSDTLQRLQACATLVLGYQPSTGQIYKATLRHCMKDRGNNSDALMAFARELFPADERRDER